MATPFDYTGDLRGEVVRLDNRIRADFLDSGPVIAEHVQKLYQITQELEKAIALEIFLTQ